MTQVVSNGVVGEIKSGIRSTEFWISALSSIGAVLAAVGGLLPSKWSAVVVAVSGAAYAVSRGLAKK